MGEQKKRIGVLTSGGDAPGMNAAIRAVVRRADNYDCEVVGIRRGYAGLLDEDFCILDTKSVADIIQRGGTILYTARSRRMHLLETQIEAADICRKNGLDAVVIIGGDGSYRGALALSKQGINVMGVPGTIDLDIGCTDYTIGFDTSINTVTDAIDKLRDTSASHERCVIVEVMGRSAGYIALWSGIAGGAEEIILPELYDHNEQAIIDSLTERRKHGKNHHIIVNAEGIGHSASMAARIEAATGIETRATILGYMQRGGSPTCKDRVYASVMGAMAVDLVMKGKKNRAVCHMNGGFFDEDLEEAIAKTKELPKDLLDVSKNLIRQRSL
ncbi:MAG: 6-phosphofructokinase [Lachnospiraceae bacterium]|nr:6-phosphofructokinase [Lachnospiraceae bacterium]